MNIGSEAAFWSNPRCTNPKGGDPSLTRKSLVLAVLALTYSGGCARAQDLPADAMQICTVDQAAFANWFGGTVTTNAVATPADSLIYREQDCDFHQWAERMFLWLTSPEGNGGRMFHSSDFYAVSPPMPPDGRRTMTRNQDHRVKFDLLRSKPMESGQAGMGYVLMAATNNSPVYYETQVNDVYAYFTTGKKTGAIQPVPTRFPITQEELDSILRFAAPYGTTFDDQNALIVEVKSAWVEADGLDTSKYITVTAEIPTYTVDPLNTKWTFTGQFKEGKLALVGLHIVGSANATSKLIWTTFEHIDNTPMATYSYKNASGQTVKVDPNPNGTWLFSKHGCALPIKPRMQSVDSDIDALPGETIGPVDTCRVNAWGVRPLDDDILDRNTQVISMNNRIRELLPRDDVRRNYVLVGTTWDGAFGNTILADSTLETFEQARGCSDCHKGDLDGNKLSHMFGPLRELPPP
jgi:hypothetical protein